MKPLILASVLILAGCTALKCNIEERVTNLVTTVVVEKLECKNPTAVKEDMKQLVDGLGLCKTKQTGIIADTLCPALVAAVIDRIVVGVIPASWNCNPLAAKNTLKDALTDACKKLPVND